MTLRIKTIDRSLLIADRSGEYYAPTKLGKTRRVTPEGYLVCVGVPIARTGEQLYGAHELPGLKPNGGGQIMVSRLPEEVFRPETLQSAEGKDFVIEHPPEGVDVTNWKNHSVGHIQNVRRGEGIEDDLIVVDILVKDPMAIEYVNKHLPELSAGYEADYEQTESGKAVQRNIVINHVAAVKAGRAGARVAVKDSLRGIQAVKTSDAILSALPSRKSILMPYTWTGNLKPLHDIKLEQIASWVSPWCAGQRLTAEPQPEMMDLGRTWVGSMIKEIDQASRSGGDWERSGVDLTDYRSGLYSLHNILGTKPIDMRAAADSIAQLRRKFRDARSTAPTQRTGDARENYRNQDMAMRQELKERNAGNAAFWSGTDRTQPMPPAASVSSGTNDGFLAAKHREANAATRDAVRSLNDANRERWAARTREWERRMGIGK